MKVKNHEAEKFALFLLSLKLKGQQNRMRSRLVRIIQNHLREVQEHHKDLLHEYCKKDENGEFKVNNDGKNSFYDIDDVKGFQFEYEILMNEEMVIENKGQNVDMLQTIAKIILDVDKEFSGEEALEYERFCEIVEEDMILS